MQPLRPFPGPSASDHFPSTPGDPCILPHLSLFLPSFHFFWWLPLHIPSSGPPSYTDPFLSASHLTIGVQSIAEASYHTKLPVGPKESDTARGLPAEPSSLPSSSNLRVPFTMDEGYWEVLRNPGEFQINKRTKMNPTSAVLA